jgi:hypothetical protein
MAEENKLDLLRDLYSRPGWKHFSEYIDNQIKDQLRIIKNRTTPSQEVDFARGALSELEGLKDKVDSDNSGQDRG